MPNLLTKEAKQSKKQETRQKETLPESIAGFAAVFVAGLFIITFVIQHFEIPSRSMENTLLVGDHVFVDRLTPMGKHGFPGPLMPYHQLHRDDVAVFVSPAEPGLYLVKRIVAVPGDRIHLRQGKVYINGVEQREPFVKHTGGYDPPRDNFPEFGPAGMSEVLTWPDVLRKNMQGDDLVIPEGKYFAMGDNRENSYDSRYWGFIPEENVMGSPLFIAWSLNQDESDFEPKPLGERVTSFLSTAVHFFGITRWNRVLRLVH